MIKHPYLDRRFVRHFSWAILFIGALASLCSAADPIYVMSVNKSGTNLPKEKKIRVGDSVTIDVEKQSNEKTIDSTASGNITLKASNGSSQLADLSSSLLNGVATFEMKPEKSGTYLLSAFLEGQKKAIAVGAFDVRPAKMPEHTGKRP